MTLISALVLLGILIFVHELGHFLFAKLSGVKVLKFSLGFGPKLIGARYGETEYQVSAIPLGGYVKMLGEEPGEELKEEDRDRAYNYQPVRKRFLIVLAGPLFNIVFATLLFIGIFGFGVPALYPDVGEVLKDSPAERAGLMVGDRIAEIDGKAIPEWSEMTDVIHKNPGRPLNFVVLRKGEKISLSIAPEKKAVKNIFGEDKEIGLIGIKPSEETFLMKFSPLEAVGLGIRRAFDVAVLTVVSIIKLIQRVIPAKTIGGPILIFQMAGEQASRGVGDFFTFMAFISINLGVINLIPIPVLDGGHLVFLTIEAVRKKPLNEKTVMVSQRVGIALILTLMAFALYNDIMRLLTGAEMP